MQDNHGPARWRVLRATLGTERRALLALVVVLVLEVGALCALSAVVVASHRPRCTYLQEQASTYLVCD